MASKASKSSSDVQKPVKPHTFDSANCGRQLWLVKVPKYLAQVWENSPEENVATINISRDAEKNLNLNLKIKIPKGKKAEECEIPMEYEICLRPIADQKMAVISHSPGDAISLSMDGHFNRRADARPAAGGADYMRMKKTQITKALKPNRVVQHTERVINFKPIAQHAHNIEADIQKRKPEGKKLRDDKDVVTEKLLAAFEKHQFYNIKDLANLTNQPVTYLKEILREFCNYNTKNPHRNMWELKPEYRHYK